VHGGEALGERLTELREQVADRVAREGMRQGWHAQLSQLTSTARGRATAERAGFTVRSLREWLSEDRTPTKSNRAAIERAYIEDRKTGRSKAIDQELRQQLSNPPRGTRIEVYTEDAPDTPRRQPTVDPDRWDEILDAFEDDDYDDLENIWEDIVDDMDTSGNEGDLLVAYVSSLGF